MRGERGEIRLPRYVKFKGNVGLPLNVSLEKRAKYSLENADFPAPKSPSKKMRSPSRVASKHSLANKGSSASV